MDRIRIALIGAGWIARQHLNAYGWLAEHGVDTFELVAVCDPNTEAARGCAQAIDGFQGHAAARVYADIPALLAGEPDLLAVDVGTPHHAVAALPCLEAGKHVLVEKPVGLTIREGRAILDAAERNHCLLAVAENGRRTWQARLARWAIDRGMIGVPRMGVWDSRVWWTHYRDWRHHKVQAGGGRALDYGVHCINLWRYLLGEARTVYGLTRLYEPYKYFEPPHRPYHYPYQHIYKETQVTGQIDRVRIDIEDSSFALIQFGQDAVVEWSLSIAAPRKEITQELLYGSEGCLDFTAETLYGDHGQVVPLAELRESMLAELDDDTRERWFPRGCLDNSFVAEVQDYVEALRLGRPPEVDGPSGMLDLAVALGVYESAEAGRVVTVDEVLSGSVDAYQREINEALGF